jgi:hypothetical protein
MRVHLLGVKRVRSRVLMWAATSATLLDDLMALTKVPQWAVQKVGQMAGQMVLSKGGSKVR